MGYKKPLYLKNQPTGLVVKIVVAALLLGAVFKKSS
jgi:hypothetical protein